MDLKKIKESLMPYVLTILLCVGFFLIIFYYLFRFAFSEFFAAHINGFKEIFSIALTILGSGAFLAVLKYFQFLGFFKEELQSVIGSGHLEERLQDGISKVFYSDDFLKKRSDLPVLWQRVTKALFKNEFPENIAAQIEKRLGEVFFPDKSISHYYKNYVLTVNVSLNENDGFLTIIERAETVIMRQDESKFDFPYTYFIFKKGVGDKTSAITFNSVTVDNQPLNMNECKPVKESEEELEMKLEMKFEGKKSYEIDSTITLVYSIERDFEYQFYCERFIDSLRIEVNFSDNLQTIFLPFGNEIFKDVETKASSFKKSYSGILLPERGFRLIFVRSPKKTTS